MDRQSIEGLHQSASEHYLRGEFREAIEAWRALLAIDPADEQALEGVRLASLLAEESNGAAGAGGADEAPASAGGRPRIDGAGANRAAGDGPGDFAERLATVLPDDGGVAPTLAQSGKAALPEPFVHEHLALAKAHAAAGRRAQAVEECRKILSSDPGQADAVRLLSECQNPSKAKDEEFLDQQLSVLDSLSVGIDGAKPEPPHPAAPHDADDPVAAPPTPGARAASRAGESGLEAVKPARDPAAAELRRRVDDLIEEAKRAASGDDVQGALEILSRVFILDEDNEGARTLEAQLRAAEGNANRDIEMCIQEGVQDFEQGKLDAARSLFQKVLARFPQHGEALDYLERIDARLAAHEGGAPSAPGPGAAGAPDRLGKDLLRSIEAPPLAAGSGAMGPANKPAADTPQTIPLQREAASPVSRPETYHSEPRLPVPTAGVATAPSASRARRLLLGVAVLVLAGGAVVAAIMLVPRLLRHRAGPPDAAAAAATATAVPRAHVSQPAQRPVATRSATEAMAAAKTAIAAEDFTAAVLAYHEVLAQDPTNEEARRGLKLAGDGYKARKAENDQLDRAKAAFAEGEYTPALRILYRMPEGRFSEEVEKYKFNSWFNLALVSLRAGNCKEATGHLDEALAIRKDDPDARRVRDFAIRFRDAVKDRSYYDTVESIPFRSIND